MWGVWLKGRMVGKDGRNETKWTEQVELGRGNPSSEGRGRGRIAPAPRVGRRIAPALRVGGK